jgi:hypothetical protein
MLENCCVHLHRRSIHLKQFKEIHKLKRFIGYAAVLALVSVPAFAAKNSAKINISRPVSVGTTQIPAADYKVTWNETGSKAQVTLTNGKSVITLPAKIVEEKHQYNSIRTDNKGGASILLGIDLSTVSVDFNSSTSSGE